MRPVLRALFLLPLSAAFACSSSDSTSDDSATEVEPLDVDFVPAHHQAPPSVANAGGPVLRSAKIVAVTFGDEPFAPQIEDLARSIGGSSYWNAVTHEYGVGHARLARAVHAPAPSATLTSNDVESWLISQLDGTHGEWGTPDAGTIYTLVYPKGTAITVDGQPMCGGQPAFHSEVKLASGVSVPYVLVARCDPFLGLAGMDYVSAALSHELVEAATDPFFYSNPAFTTEPDRYVAWSIVTGGEVADMCTLTTSVYFKPADLGMTVQRSWSNASAAAGHDPCVPAAPLTAYFNAAPRMPDLLNGKYLGQPIAPEGVKIALGETKTIDVDLFSDRRTRAPWTVKAVDFGEMSGVGANLTFAWDKDHGSSGDTLKLSITRVKDDPNMPGVDAFVVVSARGKERHAWVGAVGD